MIKQIPCVIKTGVKCSGNIFITNYSLCFDGKVFGSRQKWSLKLVDIQDITTSEDKDKLIITTAKGQSVNICVIF